MKSINSKLLNEKEMRMCRYLHEYRLIQRERKKNLLDNLQSAKMAKWIIESAEIEAKTIASGAKVT